MSDLRAVYDILTDVYRQGAYASLALSRRVDSVRSRDFVTRFVYGVLDRDTELDHYIGAMVSRKPHGGTTILLKMGMYCVLYMDSVPDYAAVNNTIELAKAVGKGASSGFLNGVLKAFCKKRPALPADKVARLSVTASVPLWIVRAYVKQYGWDKTQEFLTTKPEEREHMRVDVARISVADMCKKLDELGVDHSPDPDLGDALFVRNTPALKALYDGGLFTWQSKCSMLCCRAAAPASGEKALDMCAAPGGKAVYLSSLADGVSVTACDIYHHRLQLIQSYAARMHRNIDVRLMDATAPAKEMYGAYDVVLCDVPCSNLGVAAKKPDVYLSKDAASVASLAEVQYKILCSGARCVKEGGKVVYSTCTLLKEENGDIVRRFLKEHREFVSEGEKQYFPDGAGMDGFFVSVLRRKGL